MNDMPFRWPKCGKLEAVNQLPLSVVEAASWQEMETVAWKEGTRFHIGTSEVTSEATKIWSCLIHTNKKISENAEIHRIHGYFHPCHHWLVVLFTISRCLRWSLQIIHFKPMGYAHRPEVFVVRLATSLSDLCGRHLHHAGWPTGVGHDVDLFSSWGMLVGL